MSTSAPATSGKLEARIAEINSYDWSQEDKERAIALAVANHETWDSTTDGGRYTPPGLCDGDYIAPRYPGREQTVNERAIREDAIDHS